MLKVNAKYKLEVDRSIDTVKFITLGGVTKKLKGSSTNTWEGIIEEANANDKINVELELGGLTGSEWTLEVSVIELKLVGNDENGKPVYVESGEYKKIDSFPIQKSMDNSFVLYDHYHKIEWEL